MAHSLRRRTPTRRFTRYASRPAVDTLEPRQLLSASPAAKAPVVTPVRGKAVPVVSVEGQPFGGTIETFTASPTETFTATIDWGDRSTPTSGSVTQTASGAFSVGGSHDYARYGAYRIKVTLTGSSHTRPIALPSAAKISDAALSADGIGFTTQKGTSFSGPVATFTDAAPNAVAAPRPTETATINWGDGTISAGSITQATPGGAFTVSGKHTYGVARTFTVRTLIHDPGGSKAAATGQAVVLGPQPTTLPSLIGDFKGSLKINTFGISTSHSFELQITAQDLNDITGTIRVDGIQAVSGTLPAQGVGELTNGNFKYTFSSGGVSGVISGHISADGKHISSGFFSASGLPIPELGSIHGSFTADLQ